MNLNDRRETFAISDHTATSYSAAEILGDENRDKVAYQGKKGWFVARWQALAIILIICLLLFVAVHIGRSTGHVHHYKHSTDSPIINKNPSVNPGISPVTPVSAARISAHTNITTEGLITSMRYLVEPINYIIYIQPFFDSSSRSIEKFTFSGNVSITLHVKEDIKYLVIGANDLRIISTTLNKIKNATDEAIHEVEENIGLSIDSYDNNEGTLNLELYKWLVPGQIYELMLEFNGDIQNLPYGLFRSYYTEKDSGETRWIVGTNLDIPFARTVFPCFDAPTQTATFQLNIARQKDMMVQTSMPYWRYTETEDGWIWERYMKTNPIPVHSLAFVVNSFVSDYRITPQISHFTIWTVTKRTDELEYVLNLGPLLIRDMESYLGIALPVKKINIYGLPQILPRQTAKIGMIYMSEADLIVKEGHTSEEHKQYVAQILAGHLIEQWLENLIMFQWRTDNWIKEALVQYFEYAMLRFAEPSWKSIEHFFVKVQQMEMDKEIADPNRQPLYIRWVPYVEESKMQFLYPINETNVFKRNEQTEALAHQHKKAETFTKPSIYTQLYEKRLTDKGACMMRMIKHIITEPLFVAAMRIFLDNSRGKIVDGDDLWDIMTVETMNTAYPGYQLLPEGVSLQVVLEDWIYTEGYPLITVTRNYVNNTITFSQYIKTTVCGLWSTENSGKTPRRLSLWHIPVSYTTENEKFFTATAPRFWLNKVRLIDIITPTDLTENHWLLVNPQQTNFYRVNYDMNNWRLLRKAFGNGEFPDIVRAQLIDDALFLGRKGRLDYEFALEFTSFLAGYREKEYIVWNTVLRHLNYIRNILLAADTHTLSENRIVSEPQSRFEDESKLSLEDAPDPNALQKFKIYMRWLISPPFNNLNSKWTETHNLDHNDRLLRSDIFLWACAMDMSECNTIARSEFDKWKNSATPDAENPIEPDMRYAILCSIMQIGGSSDFRFLLMRYENTPYTSPEKRTLLKSLYCYNSDKQYEMFLSSTLSDDYSVEYLHKITMLWSTIPQSFYVSKVPFEYMVENWDVIKNRFSEFKTIMTTIVESATSNLQDDSQLEKLKKLRDENIADLPYLEHTFDDAIRNLEDRIEWKEKQMEQFITWLENNSEKGIYKLSYVMDELHRRVNTKN